MNDAEPILEELLSAYLDGELSETEALRVEKQLERDIELRQSLNELSEIRDQIRRLPKHSLPTDFATRVTSQIASQVAPENSVVKHSSPQRRFQLASVVAAIAALLLISVIGVKYLPGPHVAMETNASNELASEVTSESVATDSSSATGMRGLASVPIPTDGDYAAVDNIALKSVPSFAGSAQTIEAPAETDTNQQLAKKLMPYGLVADYQVDAQQLAAISPSWEKWADVTADKENPNTRLFVVEGTHEEISNLLGAVQARKSKIAGPSLGEFARRGLSLYPRLEGRGDSELAESSIASARVALELEAGKAPTDAPRFAANQLNRRRQSTSADLMQQMPAVANSLPKDNFDGIAADAVEEGANDELEKLDSKPPRLRVLVRFEEVN